MPIMKRVGAHVGNSLADLLTVASGKAIKVQSIVAANVDGANSATVSALWTDAANANEPIYIAKAVEVEIGDVASLLSSHLFLTAGDKIRATASTSGDIDLTVSYWEFDQA